MKALRTVLLIGVLSLAHVQTRALDRPAWMDNPGIVMAGSWEAPCYRGRGAGRMDFTLPPEKVAAYEREHSAKMIAELKDLGVNFLMIHGYKGAGMATEAQGMEDARQFAALARKYGMRIGAYVGGTMLHERLFVEEPLARQWQAFAADGSPIYYNDRQRYRYASVRNHPGFIDYIKEPTRYGVKIIGSDMIHYDNFGLGAASADEFSKEQFQAYLVARGLAPADPPFKATKNNEPLVREWRDYKCQALTDYYAAMSQFIRSLNPQCAVECNPGSVDDVWGGKAGNDFARLLPWGNAFWDESYGPDSPHSKPPGIRSSRIRSMKVGRLYENSVFCYTDTPLDAAESMAFNLNCLGCVAWFQWGEMTSIHENRPVLPTLRPYIRFFNKHQDLYRKSQTVADVAVLRTYADQQFGPRRFHGIEQALIEDHAAWRIIFDEHLDALEQYRAVVIPDKEWLSPAQQEKLAAYAARGGKLVTSAEAEQRSTFPASLHDKFRILVEAPPSVAVELCQQQNPPRLLVHLVNYEPGVSVKNILIKLRLAGTPPRSARVLSPEHPGGRRLSLKHEWDLWSCVLPELKVYACVSISVPAP
jgi:hypothetical protein